MTAQPPAGPTRYGQPPAGRDKVAQTTHPRPTLLTADFTAHFSTRPATLVFGVSANLLIGGPGVSTRQFKSGDYGHIHWTRWTTTHASGNGIIWINDCSPNCPEGSYEPSHVMVSASDGSSGHYRRLSFTYRFNGRRSPVHSILKRLPGPPVAWDWQ